MHIDYLIEKTDLPIECIQACSQSGQVYEYVHYWCQKLDLSVNTSAAKRCLKGYGAWTQEELDRLTNEEIAEKILWLACGNFADDDMDFFSLDY